MPDAAYFRTQAETYRKLARTILDREGKASLTAMAEEYDRRAELLEAADKPAPPEE